MRWRRKRHEPLYRKPDSRRLRRDNTRRDAAAYLLGLWGLPAPIVEAVAFHHTPARSDLRSFGPLAAVHVANVLEQEFSKAQPCGDFGAGRPYLAAIVSRTVGRLRAEVAKLSQLEGGGFSRPGAGRDAVLTPGRLRRPLQFLQPRPPLPAFALLLNALMRK